MTVDPVTPPGYSQLKAALGAGQITFEQFKEKEASYNAPKPTPPTPTPKPQDVRLPHTVNAITGEPKTSPVNPNSDAALPVGKTQPPAPKIETPTIPPTTAAGGQTSHIQPIIRTTPPPPPPTPPSLPINPLSDANLPVGQTNPLIGNLNRQGALVTSLEPAVSYLGSQLEDLQTKITKESDILSQKVETVKSAEKDVYSYEKELSAITPDINTAKKQLDSFNTFISGNSFTGSEEEFRNYNKAIEDYNKLVEKYDNIYGKYQDTAKNYESKYFEYEQQKGIVDPMTAQYGNVLGRYNVSKSQYDKEFQNYDKQLNQVVSLQGNYQTAIGKYQNAFADYEKQFHDYEIATGGYNVFQRGLISKFESNPTPENLVTLPLSRENYLAAKDLLGNITQQQSAISQFESHPTPEVAGKLLASGQISRETYDQMKDISLNIEKQQAQGKEVFTKFQENPTIENIVSLKSQYSSLPSDFWSPFTEAQSQLQGDITPNETFTISTWVGGNRNGKPIYGYKISSSTRGVIDTGEHIGSRDDYLLTEAEKANKANQIALDSFNRSYHPTLNDTVVSETRYRFNDTPAIRTIQESSFNPFASYIRGTETERRLEIDNALRANRYLEQQQRISGFRGSFSDIGLRIATAPIGSNIGVNLYQNETDLQKAIDRMVSPNTVWANPAEIQSSFEPISGLFMRPTGRGEFVTSGLPTEFRMVQEPIPLVSPDIKPGEIGYHGTPLNTEGIAGRTISPFFSASPSMFNLRDDQEKILTPVSGLNIVDLQNRIVLTPSESEKYQQNLAEFGKGLGSPEAIEKAALVSAIGQEKYDKANEIIEARRIDTSNQWWSNLSPSGKTAAVVASLGISPIEVGGTYLDRTIFGNDKVSVADTMYRNLNIEGSKTQTPWQRYQEGLFRTATGEPMMALGTMIGFGAVSGIGTNIALRAGMSQTGVAATENLIGKGFMASIGLDIGGKIIQGKPGQAIAELGLFGGAAILPTVQAGKIIGSKLSGSFLDAIPTTGKFTGFVSSKFSPITNRVLEPITTKIPTNIKSTIKDTAEPFITRSEKIPSIFTGIARRGVSATEDIVVMTSNVANFPQNLAKGIVTGSAARAREVIPTAKDIAKFSIEKVPTVIEPLVTKAESFTSFISEKTPDFVKGIIEPVFGKVKTEISKTPSYTGDVLRLYPQYKGANKLTPIGETSLSPKGIEKYSAYNRMVEIISKVDIEPKTPAGFDATRIEMLKDAAPEVKKFLQENSVKKHIIVKGGTAGGANLGEGYGKTNDLDLGVGRDTMADDPIRLKVAEDLIAAIKPKYKNSRFEITNNEADAIKYKQGTTFNIKRDGRTISEVLPLQQPPGTKMPELNYVVKDYKNVDGILIEPISNLFANQVATQLRVMSPREMASSVEGVSTKHHSTVVKRGEGYTSESRAQEIADIFGQENVPSGVFDIIRPRAHRAVKDTVRIEDIYTPQALKLMEANKVAKKTIAEFEANVAKTKELKFYSGLPVEEIGYEYGKAYYEAAFKGKPIVPLFLNTKNIGKSEKIEYVENYTYGRNERKEIKSEYPNGNYQNEYTKVKNMVEDYYPSNRNIPSEKYIPTRKEIKTDYYEPIKTNYESIKIKNVPFSDYPITKKETISEYPAIPSGIKSVENYGTPIKPSEYSISKKEIKNNYEYNYDKIEIIPRSYYPISKKEQSQDVYYPVESPKTEGYYEPIKIKQPTTYPPTEYYPSDYYPPTKIKFPRPFLDIFYNEELDSEIPLDLPQINKDEKPKPKKKRKPRMRWHIKPRDSPIFSGAEKLFEDKETKGTFAMLEETTKKSKPIKTKKLKYNKRHNKSKKNFWEV